VLVHANASPDGLEREDVTPQRALSPFGAFVAGTFLFGWLAGLAVVFKLWLLAGVPRWMIFNGVGYVSMMLVPALSGFAFARAIGRLAGRGFGAAPLGLLGLGIVGLVAGLCAL
jgi:hypothetical protein